MMGTKPTSTGTRKMRLTYSQENSKDTRKIKEVKSLSYPNLRVVEPEYNNADYVPKEALKSKEYLIEFTSILAHEVRNPLATILLSTEMLDDAVDNNALKMYIEIIERCSKRINDLITELLKFQQSDETKEESNYLSVILDEVLAILYDRIQLKNIKVIKNYISKDAEIVANRQKMKIALTNIILNAIEAMPLSKGVLKLTIKPTTAGILLRIEDNGCGISQDNLKHIFTTGFTNKPGGLGFGLGMTKSILHANNGDVKVASKEGKWTRFTLLFGDNPPLNGASHNGLYSRSASMDKTPRLTRENESTEIKL